MDKIIANLLTSGIADGVFPGAAAAVSWGMGLKRQRSWAIAGLKDNRYPDQPVNKTTLFDLASLSKPLSTTLILYSLLNEKKISLDDTLATFFNSFDNDPDGEKKRIYLSLLCSHSSGLVGYREYFKEFAAVSDPQQREQIKEQLLAKIIKEPLACPPASTCIYSDLGFILLGHIIEKVTGADLESNFRKYIACPLGIENEVFYLSAEGTDRNNFAATEDCPWRERIMSAEVHDEHCWLMNGSAGHAGLFGSIIGVQLLCEAILDQWQGKRNDYSWSAMLKERLQRQYPDQSWCLGFDTPSAESSSGRYFSQQSIGHLGYAGTSFWIDPERELVVVLLTNRVHPDRNNIKIRKFRPCFHDAVVEGLIGKNIRS